MGDECIESLRALNITYPIENGVIQHWDDMEEIWKYTFQRKLGIDMDDNGAVSPDGLRIMLTEAPLNPKDNRRKMAEIMFEKFHFAGLQCKPQAMLTLYSRGASTGVVVDSGDGVTHVMGVFDGYVLNHLTRRLNIAGRHVTRHLLNLLQQRMEAIHIVRDGKHIRQDFALRTLDKAVVLILCHIDTNRNNHSKNLQRYICDAVPQNTLLL